MVGHLTGYTVYFSKDLYRCQGFFKLFNRSARRYIERIRVNWGDAREDLVVSGGTDHGSIVAGKLGLGEIDLYGIVAESLEGFVAEKLISTDAASENDGFDVGVILIGGTELG